MIEKHTEKLFRKILLNLKPPEQISVSEWADRYRRLPRESSSESGMWKTSRTPYLKKIMDSVSDPTVRKIAIMSSAQIGKSELIINIIGYYVHIDPTSILLVQPTEKTAKGFSTKRIEPSIRDTPVLEELVNHRESAMLEKKFPGGFLSIVGSNSPATLSSQPIQILCCDEVDRYELSAGHEGDPLKLAEKRTLTYQDIDKHIFVSTPTLKGVSRIEDEFLLGTMEEWELPCPGCGEFQVLTWNKIKFVLDEKRKLVESEPVLCLCEHCGELNDEYAWKKGDGRWQETKENKEIKTFHLASLVSPWRTWDKIVKDFLDSKNDKEKLKVWTNTELGETFALFGDGVESSKLLQRREKYGCDLPEGVLIITAGVDVQNDRVEIEVVGWGENYESWGIKYHKIYGEPTSSELWDNLDLFLSQTFKFANGNELSIALTCIDTGGGHTSQVYKFLKRKRNYRIMGIKGMGGANAIAFIHKKPTLIKNYGIRIQILGVNSGKTTVMGRLQSEMVGESYCHFPVEYDKGYDEVYFDGLTAEHQVIKFISGQKQAVWELKKSNARNEPFDCRNYATAAIEMLNPNFEALKEKILKGINHAKRKGKK